MTPKFHSLRVKEVRKETDDTVSVAFDIPSELVSDYQFQAGQYLTLRTTIDGQDVRRSYSICAAPFENDVRVAIKRVENGVFSTWATTQLAQGQQIEVMTPMGNFAFKPNPVAKNSYVLFAAGSGVTPILAIAKTILKEEPLSDVTLVYGNKGFASIIFREELEGLKNLHLDRFRLIHVLSRESLGNPLQKGRIDSEKVNKLCVAFFKQQPIDGVYICGPEEMIHSVRESLSEFGVDENKIHFELFGTSSAPKKVNTEIANGPQVTSNVTIIIDGDHIELDLTSSGLNILEAGHNAGADLPYACKGGVCCTCKAKVLEGSAVMDVNYALDKDEVAAGYILTCQAHPTSEKLTVSFDD